MDGFLNQSWERDISKFSSPFPCAAKIEEEFIAG
jgi:hypothetical protein